MTQLQRLREKIDEMHDKVIQRINDTDTPYTSCHEEYENWERKEALEEILSEIDKLEEKEKPTFTLEQVEEIAKDAYADGMNNLIEAAVLGGNTFDADEYWEQLKERMR